jgi:hypothetical protein
VLVAAVLLALACNRAKDDPAQSLTEGPFDRFWTRSDARDHAGRTSTAMKRIRGEWRPAGGVPPDTGSAIINPLLVAGSGRQIVAFDHGDGILKAFAVTGHLLWTFGRPGQGPWEFANPTDLRMDGWGVIYVADPANGRVTVVGSDGQPRRVIPVPRPFLRIASTLADGSIWLTGGTTAMALKVSPDGQPLDSIPFPPGIDTLAPIVRVVEAAGGPEGGLALGFYRASWLGIVAPDGPKSGREISAPEFVAFPAPLRLKLGDAVVTRLHAEARVVTLEMVIDDGRFHVLVADTTWPHGRRLDSYAYPEGTYLGSRQLPARVSAMTLSRGRLIGLVTDPAPMVGVWRWEVGE